MTSITTSLTNIITAPLLLALVMFGLFCGGLALAGMIGDKIEEWYRGGRGERY